jgi:uncharacterized protein YpbB
MHKVKVVGKKKCDYTGKQVAIYEKVEQWIVVKCLIEKDVLDVLD